MKVLVCEILHSRHQLTVVPTMIEKLQNDYDVIINEGIDYASTYREDREEIQVPFYFSWIFIRDEYVRREIGELLDCSLSQLRTTAELMDGLDGFVLFAVLNESGPVPPRRKGMWFLYVKGHADPIIEKIRNQYPKIEVQTYNGPDGREATAT